MAESSESESKEGLSKHRLEALGDGIFAFAMTLLVLDVKMPKISEAIQSPELLTRALLELWPKFLSYITSFIVLAVFWIAQIGYLHFVKRTDRWFLWLNLLFLMVVVFVPFSTDLLGDYHTLRLAVVIYGCNIMALGVTLFLQWHYATSRHRLVGHDVEPELVRRGNRRILAGVCSYAFAILLVWFNPTVSLILYVLIPIMYILPSRLDHHWMHSHG
jgi:uncharacterized membrane protein